MKRVRQFFTSRVASVLARAHKKVERKNNEVFDGFAGFCRGRVRNNELHEVAQDSDGDRLCALGCRVGFRAVPKLVLEAQVSVAMTVWTRVRGPHAGERLAHVTERCRCRCMSNGFATGCKSSISDSSGEDLKEVDGIGDVTKGRVLTEGATEAGPNVPGFIAPITVSSSDSGAGCCLCSADVREERISGLKWHDCQGSL